MIIQPGEDPGLPFGSLSKKISSPEAAPAPADDMASRILELAENFRADLAAKDRIIADLVENNSRLTRLVEEYKKAPAAAPGIPAPAVAD